MKVFLSYDHTDAEAARCVADRLGQAGFEVWDASRDLMPGDDWPSSLKEALETSDAMVVLLSPDAVASPWVRREIEYALGSLRYQNRLIPVIVQPTDKFPWILRRLQLVPFRDDRASQAEEIVRALKRADDSSAPEARAP